MKRMRGRNHRPGIGASNGGGGGFRAQTGNVPLNRNHSFDSQGPDLRLRGTAQQLFEKYLQLGRDATSAGDRVMAESYFQHAEHYFRILGAMQAVQQQPPPQQPNGSGNQNAYRRYQPDGDVSEGQNSAEPPDEAAETREIPIAAAPPED